LSEKAYIGIRIVKNGELQLGVVVHASDHSTLEAKAKRSQVPGLPGLHREKYRIILSWCVWGISDIFSSQKLSY
jgi:hypothetical protein